jgi:hypothetical protein
MSQQTVWICHHVHARYPIRVLDCDQRDYRFAIDTHSMERLEIGLQTGPAAGIRAGDGKRYARCHLLSVVVTGILDAVF